MKNFFLIIALSLTFSAQLNAATHEFSSIEEAKVNASARNKEILDQSQEPEELPSNDEEMVEYIQNRVEDLDITVLPDGDTFDKISSFSRVDDLPPEEKKSMWEKIYDGAMERISGAPGVNTDIRPVEYYTPKRDIDEEEQEEEQVPLINLQLPNGVPLQAVAYEHIPYFAAQIDVLPNRMLQVQEDIVVVANGRKVKEPLARFIRKKPISGHGKMQLILEDVVINGSRIPYEVMERRDYYVIRPQQRISLPEGAYVFEFKYVLDRSLWDYGDFYEFYWNLTGGTFNLLVERAIVSLKLPGREPATKYYALTGKAGQLNDKNAVVTKGNDNIMGFMNLKPLMNGESLHIFLTLPKVDFLPETDAQRVVNWIENKGDIVLSALYLLAVIISSILSWRYIQKRLKFKSVTLSSVLVVRALWRGGADVKSIGCALLDLFRKHLIDIEERENDIILVRKTTHARRIAKFDRKLLGLLFSKKDSICRLVSSRQVNSLKTVVRKETEKNVKKLGLYLSRMYLFFNAAMLIVAEAGFILWNPNSTLLIGFALINIWLIFMACIYLIMKSTWFCKIILFGMLVVLLMASAILLSVYLCWQAIAMLLLAVCISIVFCKRTSEIDALLKNGVQSACQMREFLIKQKETIENGRNFAVQQPNIFALDLESEYKNNSKIKSNYRLDMVQKLLEHLY